MEAINISPAQARLKLTLLDKQAEAKSNWEFYSEMKGFGLPSEVIEILEQVLKTTSQVAGKTVSIGKIIVSKLLQYVAEHPLQVVGLAAGLCTTYALGVALGSLFALVPGLAKIWGIGAGLSKLALLIAGLCKTAFTPLMIASPIVGAVGGEILDNKFPQVSESFQAIAKDFFDLFSQIINAIKNDFEHSEHSPAFS